MLNMSYFLALDYFEWKVMYQMLKIELEFEPHSYKRFFIHISNDFYFVFMIYYG